MEPEQTVSYRIELDGKILAGPSDNPSKIAYDYRKAIREYDSTPEIIEETSQVIFRRKIGINQLEKISAKGNPRI